MPGDRGKVLSVEISLGVACRVFRRPDADVLFPTPSYSAYNSHRRTAP